MPHFDAMANAALTPGGVQSGLNDLVSALVNAPLQRRQIEQKAAEEDAARQFAQKQFDASQANQAWNQQFQSQKMGQDQSQFDAKLHQDALLGGLRYSADKQAQEMTPEKALGRISPVDYAVDKDTGFNTRTSVAPEEMARRAQALVAALHSGQALGAGIVPADRVMPGGSTDPHAAAVRQAILSQLVPQLQAQAQQPQMQPAMAPPSNSPAPSAREQGPAPKVITAAQVQAKLKPGWTLERAVKYYQDQGYTVQ